MKKTLILYTVLFISFCAKAQDIKNLYFISGHPYDNTDEEFASYLWRYSESSLDTISLLSSKDDFLENVKVYPEQNLAVIHKSNSIRKKHLGHNHRLLFIDYQDSVRFSEVPIKIEEGKFEYYLSLTEESLLLDMFSNKKGSYFNKVDLENLNIKEADIKDFIHAKLTGIPGGMIDGKDYFLVYSNEQNGNLEIPLVGDRDERPRFSYALPEQYQFKSYQRHVIPINNSKIFVLHGKYEKASPKLGSSEIIYLNKENNSWNKVTIQGNMQKPRGFGEWISGYVFNDHIAGKNLPGAEKWTYRESGLSPKERWDYYPEYGEGNYPYAPGILYFYNAYTKEYFELETNQADSEVILIKDNTVIYRTYDELYAAEIIKGQKLGKSKLLLKDDRVPDIHWAFFGVK
ncbi:hypothetical protein [Marinoscillum furvescens]|uniref:Uncharacterized protein n=1 Tax=Marinoscillum furvescens DSM 4134 TaxID=1122208 RepID=A0A3D9L4N4_MARFU|nr:hypothetical protein [Marinoscillum furvescens]REE00542.1 hypothetical protein C7460_105168 [Marinoscillum furvescens DSM 4134]